MPVICKDFSYTIVRGLELSEFCKEKVAITAKELQDELKELEI